MKKLQEENTLERLIDFSTLKIRIANLTERQKMFAHLIDPRFFRANNNPFRNTSQNFQYETPVELEAELFYLHPLMDPATLEQGAIRRFPSGVNEKYIREKYFEDKWVSDGNHELALQLERYLSDNLTILQQKDRIRIADIGPCGGAITTLFALRAFDRVGLLEKVEVVMLDIVPNVLEATLLGKYNIPEEMIQEYGLGFAGNNGQDYINLLKNGVLIGVKEWYENKDNPKGPYTTEALQISEQIRASNKRPSVLYFRGDGEKLPEELANTCDVVLSAYTHHHMNLYGRKMLSEQMETAATTGGFIGVADFYVSTYAEYMEWYRPHFEKYGDAPPVECPRVSAKILASWFTKTTIMSMRDDLMRSFVFSGIKQ